MESGQEATEAHVPITRALGVTTAERYLKTLCDGTFLSMWSYAEIYRDQREGGRRHGDGKEVCDLLVVFENHIIIFSDKDCAFSDTGDLEVDWKRWYRKAIGASAKQLWGAERWIRTHPDRLFVDRACRQPFPIALPDGGVMQVHRIVVAHDASGRCTRHLGGSGSLMLDSTLDGMGEPFTVGHIDRVRGFVHVLDDTTLGIVLRTLDTIADFVAYFTRKERLLLGHTAVHAAGEEELLSFCSPANRPGRAARFRLRAWLPRRCASGRSLGAIFASNPLRQAQIAADAIGYAWDALIETFARHSFGHTQHFAWASPGWRTRRSSCAFWLGNPARGGACWRERSTRCCARHHAPSGERACWCHRTRAIPISSSSVAARATGSRL